MQFFDMPKYDAIKALAIYKRAGMQVCQLINTTFVLWYYIEFKVSILSNQQAENLADFYDFCKDLELARTFQFPTLRQVCSSITCCTSCHLDHATTVEG
jgi:UDP-3-O-acyl-N-acetylglucosamine deacetylase